VSRELDPKARFEAYGRVAPDFIVFRMLRPV
jgi:hypothetical protein